MAETIEMGPVGALEPVLLRRKAADFWSIGVHSRDRLAMGCASRRFDPVGDVGDSASRDQRSRFQATPIGAIGPTWRRPPHLARERRPRSAIKDSNIKCVKNYLSKVFR
jgi:hypothetical protein